MEVPKGYVREKEQKKISKEIIDENILNLMKTFTLQTIRLTKFQIG
jgi:hypothetical protein